MSETKAKTEAVVCDYHSPAIPGRDCMCCDHSIGLGHRSYKRQLHGPDNDWRLDPAKVLDTLIRESGAKDGDTIEIAVRMTGERPFNDRKMHWVSSGTYAREGTNPDGLCVIPSSAEPAPQKESPNE